MPFGERCSGKIKSVRDEKRADCWKTCTFKYQCIIFINPLSTVYLFIFLKKKNPEVLVQSSLYFQAFDKFKKREN